MKSLYVLVVDQAVSRLFSSRGMPPVLTLLEETVNPEGRLKEGEFASDKNGRMYDGAGPNKSGFQPQTSYRETSVRRFLKSVVAGLKSTAGTEPFELVAIAGPQMMGWLRPELEGIPWASVVGEVLKDLSQNSPQEIAQYVYDEVV